MEEYVTRDEFEHFKQEVKQKIEQRHTDEITAFSVNVASQDVVTGLSELKQELKTVSETWLDTLQEHYTEHKSAIDDVQTVQKGHAKFFEEHGKRLAATATKDDISKLETRFDEQGKKVDQMFQILQKLQEKLGG